MLDPSIGRWTSEDPLLFDAGDPNLYRYVGNNPTNFTDPSGLIEFDPLAYFKERVKSAPGRVLDNVTNWAAQKITAPVQYAAQTAKGAWDGVQTRVQGAVDQAAATVTRVEMEVAVARMAAPLVLRQFWQMTPTVLAIRSRQWRRSIRERACPRISSFYKILVITREGPTSTLELISLGGDWKTRMDTRLDRHCWLL
jgi:hypothetical protein